MSINPPIYRSVVHDTGINPFTPLEHYRAYGLLRDLVIDINGARPEIPTGWRGWFNATSQGLAGLWVGRESSTGTFWRGRKW